MEHWWLLIPGGLIAGLLSGLFGIGGGSFVVPYLTVIFGLPAAIAIGTSSLSIVLTSASGTLQNWRMGKVDWRRTFSLGAATIVTVPLGTGIAEFLPDHWLKLCFGLMLLLNVFLSAWKRQVARASEGRSNNPKANPWTARGITGGIAGLMAGLFGVGGGVVMVPLQMILLGEPIKVAIQTSLSVIVLTGTLSTATHEIAGNVLWNVGIILGLGGVVGAQISTRFLPKLPDRLVRVAFNGMLIGFAGLMFWRAWASYDAVRVVSLG